jgi:hypothetical protein
MKKTQNQLLVGEAATIRGGNSLGKAEDSNILTTAFEALEKETTGIFHGTVSLTIHVKDGKCNRYAISRERSFIPGKPTTGGNNGGQL